MRRVKFKKWISACYINYPNDYRTLVEGTGCFEKDFLNDGIFHQWGLAIEDSSSYSIALVELNDGTIIEVLPNNLKFV